MAGTILPIVYGKSGNTLREKHYIIIWLHVLGSLTGAAVVGSLLGAFGAVFPWDIIPIQREALSVFGISLLSLLYAVHEVGLYRMPTPQSYWQVPQIWSRSMPTRVMASFYGLGLGVGLLTAIPVGTFYVITLGAIFTASPVLGAIILSAFGLGRALPLLCMAYAFNNNDESYRFAPTIVRWQPAVHYINGLALSATSAYFFAVGVIDYIRR
jgi:sulfite exporter TauE/SafE